MWCNQHAFDESPSSSRFWPVRPLLIYVHRRTYPTMLQRWCSQRNNSEVAYDNAGTGIEVSRVAEKQLGPLVSEMLFLHLCKSRKGCLRPSMWEYHEGQDNEVNWWSYCYVSYFPLKWNRLASWIGTTCAPVRFWCRTKYSWISTLSNSRGL